MRVGRLLYAEDWRYSNERGEGLGEGLVSGSSGGGSVDIAEGAEVLCRIFTWYCT